MSTPAIERETIISFSDDDRLNGGNAVLSTFSSSLKKKALAQGGKIVREHIRAGTTVSWDIEIPAKQVRIGFKRPEKSPARVTAALKRHEAQKTGF